MPIIKVWCLPDLEEYRLRNLYREIVDVVESISELGLKGQNAITVLFPKDSMRYGLGEEIIIEVAGLFEKPERTPKVCQELAKRLGETVKEMFPDAKVECFIYLFNPADGFWSSADKKCVECGAEINSKESVSLYVGCICEDENVFPCKHCGRLHFADGEPVFRGEEKVFFINDQIVGRPLSKA